MLANPYNLFVHSFEAYGVHDRRYRVDPPTAYGSNIDKVVHAVEVPAGLIDGPLCVLWLIAILNGRKWLVGDESKTFRGTLASHSSDLYVSPLFCISSCA